MDPKIVEMLSTKSDTERMKAIAFSLACLCTGPTPYQPPDYCPRAARGKSNSRNVYSCMVRYVFTYRLFYLNKVFLPAGTECLLFHWFRIEGFATYFCFSLVSLRLSKNSHEVIDALERNANEQWSRKNGPAPPKYAWYFLFIDRN